MNRATAISRAVLETLLECGVRDVVLAPGSRSAGLAIAAAQLEALGEIRLHVRIDEREAGFLALGLAKTDRSPVAVVVTSGTAVANLLPAIVEAYQSGLPLIAVTADRPEYLRGSAAPQTINQVHFAAPYVVSQVDVDAAATDVESIRAALRTGIGLDQNAHARRGPVHINVQFELPLLPDRDDVAWIPKTSQTGAIAATTAAAKSDSASNPQSETNLNALQSSGSTAAEDSAPVVVPARGVMVLGDISNPSDAVVAGSLAARLGWPIVWEPSANAHSLPNALSHGSLIAGAMPVPEMVITIGTVGLSRSVLGLLKATNRHISVHLSCNGPDRPDPVRSADEILEHIPNATTTVEPAWLEMWRAADATASQIVTEGLRGQSLTGASAAVELWHHLADEATLLVGASWPVRHIEAFAPVRSGVRVFGNRGANGIDGLLSTAYGLALCASHRTYALVGDVSFLYGAHGLLHGTERAANLTVVVLDNDGGGIFSQLEQSAPEFDSYFERVFGTPHGRDLWVVAESLGAPAVRVTTREELVTALRRTDSLPGLHVIVVTTSARNSEATLLRDLAARVAQAVT